MGVDVDVSAATGEQARIEGWRRAQGIGWRMLWARTHNRPLAEAPNLSDSVLNSIVAGIVIDNEQIGPNRYIARLGVLFDRARTSQMLGVSGDDPALGADAGDPGDDHRLGRLQLRVPQPVAARLGGVPHRGQRDRLCPAAGRRDRPARAQLCPDPAARARLVADAARSIWRGRHRRARGRPQARLSGRPGGGHLHRALRAGQ